MKDVENLTPEEIRQVLRAAEAVRIGMNKHYNDRTYYVRLTFKIMFWLIAGFFALSYMLSDTTDPFFGKWIAQMQNSDN